jgi:hypothetical protein
LVAAEPTYEEREPRHGLSGDLAEEAERQVEALWCDPARAAEVRLGAKLLDERSGAAPDLVVDIESEERAHGISFNGFGWVER